MKTNPGPRRLWQTADMSSYSIPGGFQRKHQTRKLRQCLSPFPNVFPQQSCGHFGGRNPETQRQEICVLMKKDILTCSRWFPSICGLIHLCGRTQGCEHPSQLGSRLGLPPLPMDHQEGAGARQGAAGHRAPRTSTIF